MYNKMAHLEVFPELRDSSFPDIFESNTSYKTENCIFEKAGFSKHLSPSICLGMEIQPRYSVTIRNDM